MGNPQPSLEKWPKVVWRTVILSAGVADPLRGCIAAVYCGGSASTSIEEGSETRRAWGRFRTSLRYSPATVKAVDWKNSLIWGIDCGLKKLNDASENATEPVASQGNTKC